MFGRTSVRSLLRFLNVSQKQLTKNAHCRRFCSSASYNPDEVSAGKPSSPTGISTAELAEQKQAELISGFRNVMRTVPSPVVVVTAAQYVDSECCIKRGVTCSSFASVSMQPPVISFCITRPSRMHSLLKDTRHFAVNVLAGDQVHYGVHFSKPARNGEDQFSAVPHKLGFSGVPLIEGTAAVLQCQAHDTHLIGDHHVWYGEVLETSMDTGTDGRQPLLYFASSFRSVGDEAFMQAFEDTTLLFDDWSHEAHLRMAWNYIRIHGKENAIPVIRNGIKKYNTQHKDKVKRGYHETVTMFFTHVIADAINQCENVDMTFEEFLSQNSHLTDSNLISQYYSKQLISSPAARLRFEPPDLQDLPGFSR
ncbi:uncharacterized protein LOC119734939 [Patiria miniata]|uniref:Flavin reductase like domain-containing protein n=1 Tax=Patiria miniata TaxID=46514 RepID=A0A914ALQ0_PATMI|nr:uncharacterized protein LOC119734939 [Patiria miniata]